MRRNSEIGIAGIGKHDNSKRESAVSKLRKENRTSESSESAPNRAWEDLESFELESALEDGVMSLESGIKDQMGQVDLVKLETRVLEMLKNNVDASVLSESDQQLFEATRADMLEDLEDFSVTEQALLKGTEVDKVAYEAEQEALMDAPPVPAEMRAEKAVTPAEALREANQSVVDQEQADMMAAELRGETANLMTEEAFAEMSTEEAEKYGTSRLQADALLQRKDELGYKDVLYGNVAELDKAINDRQTISNKIKEIQTSTGFLSRVFGKAARDIRNNQVALMQLDSQIDHAKEFLAEAAISARKVDSPSSKQSSPRRTNRRAQPANFVGNRKI